MKKIIIINEDGSREEIPDVTAYGLAAVTGENISKIMELECSSMDALVLAGNMTAIAEEIAESAGMGKIEIERMAAAVKYVDSEEDGGNDENQN